VYEKEHSRRDPLPKDEDDAFKPEQEQKQIEQYEMLFRVFRDFGDTLTGVTFWNISDRYSWLDNFPVRGRKNYPLLFDGKLQPKKAYYKVIDFEK
jgi:endo-1,4-beta-xylanase